MLCTDRFTALSVTKAVVLYQTGDPDVMYGSFYSAIHNSGWCSV
jgi:hypothetical protein